MGKLSLSYKIWTQKFKPRFIFLSILSIILIFSLPGLLNLAENWAPTGSIDDIGDYGYSTAFDVIGETHNIHPIRSKFIDVKLKSSNELLVILTPENKFSAVELDFIQLRISANLPTLIVGSLSMGRTELHEIERHYFGLGADRIFDKINNANDVGLPLSQDNFGGEYVSVVPTEIHGGFQSEDQILSTFETSTSESCIRQNIENPTCFYSRTIIARNRQFMVFTDGWMLRNYYTRQFPQNTELLDVILNSFETTITDVYIDETHLDWIPINRDGFEISTRNLLVSDSIFFALLIFGVILPLLLSLNNELIGFTYTGVFGSGIGKKMFKRLDRIHTSRVVAVPLSLEERILTLENLEAKTMGRKYLSKIARELIIYLDENKLRDSFPAVNLNNLIQLSLAPMLETDGWQIIGDTNQIIDLIAQNESLLSEDNRIRDLTDLEG